jgi:hypothetical protein
LVTLTETVFSSCAYGRDFISSSGEASKKENNMKNAKDPNMLGEYDFSKGVQGST